MTRSTEDTSLSGQSRELPERIIIPEIKGEMVHLRPATLDDLARMEELEAFYNASGITGKDRQAERAVVRTWVRRSVAWAWGQKTVDSGVGDPEFRRTIAWALVAEPTDRDADNKSADESDADRIIGMIFLIDIDGWARSARIQVVLGKDYRGRGYSRDAMPRVMTYGFAPEPVGLGLHRIWVSVPEKNTRSISVYQSLGFLPLGVSRDALWDASAGKYQDLIVMDSLVDEYDPIRSLDAFGMHVFEENPGVKEAMTMQHITPELHHLENKSGIVADRIGKGHISASEQSSYANTSESGQASNVNSDAHASSPVASQSDVQKDFVSGDDALHSGESEHASLASQSSGSGNGHSTSQRQHQEHYDANPSSNWHFGSGRTDGEEVPDQVEWPYNQTDRKPSKRAWWRSLGNKHKQTPEERKD
ncbi:GNAT family N-acetyltransferase [Bifidobacterium aquikefiricola]|uniref:GNAT family N-acetyltransferase n=1 Tax=Bifidobacterium aquikefiricola TaxID=3059038 RepID=A0AB39U697_9BIFI